VHNACWAALILLAISACHSACTLCLCVTGCCSMWDKSSVFGPGYAGAEGDTVTTGTPLTEPPLIDMISNDPVLSSVKVRGGTQSQG